MYANNKHKDSNHNTPSPTSSIRPCSRLSRPSAAHRPCGSAPESRRGRRACFVFWGVVCVRASGGGMCDRRKEGRAMCAHSTTTTHIYGGKIKRVCARARTHMIDK